MFTLWLLLLTSCGGPNSVNIDALLVQNGDLPAGIKGGHIRDDTPIDDPANVSSVAYQDFVREGKVVGGVTVWLFPYSTTASTAYDTVVANLPVNIEPDALEVGEQRAGGIGQPPRMAFVRCRTIAYITFNNIDSSSLIEYAKRLDQRLSSTVC